MQGERQRGRKQCKFPCSVYRRDQEEDEETHAPIIKAGMTWAYPRDKAALMGTEHLVGSYWYIIRVVTVLHASVHALFPRPVCPSLDSFRRGPVALRHLTRTPRKRAHGAMQWTRKRLEQPGWRRRKQRPQRRGHGRCLVPE